MKLADIHVGQTVQYRGELVRVVKVTRQRVFIDDGGELPDIVSPRALQPAEAELTAPQAMYVEACRWRPSERPERTWQPLDYVAAAASVFAVGSLHWLIAMLA